MRSTTPLLAAAALLATGATLSADAAPKPKPITKTYTATAATPDPTNYAEMSYSVCAQAVPGSFHTETFKAPAPGKLKIELSEFAGDWDLLLLDGKGSEVATGGASDVGSPATPVKESLTAKVKKAGTTYKIISCNWAGGPTGKVTYTFTYL